MVIKRMEEVLIVGRRMVGRTIIGCFDSLSIGYSTSVAVARLMASISQQLHFLHCSLSVIGLGPMFCPSLQIVCVLFLACCSLCPVYY